MKTVEDIKEECQRKSPAADVIKECRRSALREVTIAPTRIYDIQKDYRTGKLIIKPKERTMNALQTTNYLQYDTRTV